MPANNVDWDRVRRRFGEVAFTHLREKRVAIIGCGSGGSWVALMLAMSGVGNFLLIDPETLSPANVVRHAAGARFIGRPKVEVVRDLILDRNDLAETRTIAGDVREEQNLKLLDGSVDLVVTAVDSEPTKQELNQYLLKMGTPAIYAGLYEKGTGGDACIARPGEACYACISHYLRESKLGAVDEKQNLDYGQIARDGTLRGEPGLGVHVASLASLQADWALRELLRGTGSSLEPYQGNAVIVANEPLVIGRNRDGSEIKLGPREVFWLEVLRSQRCLICNPPQETSVTSLDELTQDSVTKERRPNDY